MQDPLIVPNGNTFLKYDGDNMLKKCKYVPVLETKRLIMREPVPDDAGDLKEWFGLEEVYQYWGNPPGRGGEEPGDTFC